MSRIIKSAFRPSSQDLLDRDVLIAFQATITEQMKGIRTDIQELKDGFKNQVNDHENRIRYLENRIWLILGVAACLSFISPYVWNLFRR